MRHLYEISAEYADLLETIYDSTEDGDGEVSPSRMDQLECISGEFTSKLDACCRVLRDLQATEKICQDEAKRLAARAKAVGNHAEWIKGYIKQCMEQAHLDKVDAGVFRLSIRKSNPSVQILDIDLVPHEFDVEQERKVSLSEIKLKIAAGQEVPGAVLTQGSHLRIA